MSSILALGAVTWDDDNVESADIAASGGTNTYTMTLVVGRTYQLSSHTGSTDCQIFCPSGASNGIHWNFANQGPFRWTALAGQTSVKVVNNGASGTDKVSLVELE